MISHWSVGKKNVAQQRKQVTLDFCRQLEINLKQTIFPNFYRTQAIQLSVTCLDCQSLSEIDTYFRIYVNLP